MPDVTICHQTMILSGNQMIHLAGFKAMVQTKIHHSAGSLLAMKQQRQAIDLQQYRDNGSPDTANSIFIDPDIALRIIHDPKIFYEDVF